MSLHPQVIPPIPEETARVAHAILPKGNVYMHMRDELGTLYQDQDFADLFPQRGQAAEARLSSGTGDGDPVRAINSRTDKPLMRCARASMSSMLLAWT